MNECGRWQRPAILLLAGATALGLVYWGSGVVEKQFRGGSEGTVPREVKLRVPFEVPVALPELQPAGSMADVIVRTAAWDRAVVIGDVLGAAPSTLAIDAADRLIVAGGNAVAVISPPYGDGPVRMLDASSPVRCLAARRDQVVAGCDDAIRVWSVTDDTPTVWPLPAEGAILTSLAVSSNAVFAADYAHRCVWRLDMEGRVEGTIRASEAKGFRLPSPYFDVAWHGGMLWVADTGRHRLSAFDAAGVEQRHWGAFGMGAGHFAGCCNPAHLAMLPNGAFVTSEKGVARISLFSGNGDFIKFICPPQAAGVGHEPMDLAVFADGRIAALDASRGRVLIFEQEPGL